MLLILAVAVVTALTHQFYNNSQYVLNYDLLKYLVKNMQALILQKLDGISTGPNLEDGFVTKLFS